MGVEDIGKNPVSEMVGEWRETGFLRRYSMGGEDIGKNPVSEIVQKCDRPFFQFSHNGDRSLLNLQ
jgi:hypothetical protein